MVAGPPEYVVAGGKLELCFRFAKCPMENWITKLAILAILAGLLFAAYLSAGLAGFLD